MIKTPINQAPTQIITSNKKESSCSTSNCPNNMQIQFPPSSAGEQTPKYLGASHLETLDVSLLSPRVAFVGRVVGDSLDNIILRTFLVLVNSDVASRINEISDESLGFIVDIRTTISRPSSSETFCRATAFAIVV